MATKTTINGMNLKIIINGKHTEKLTSVLDAIQNRCTARTLDVERIEAILDRATRAIGVAAAHMKGSTIKYTGAEHFPSAYKYTPDSTHFEATHNGRYWVVTAIYRYTCPNRCDNTHITPSDDAIVAITKKLSCCYC
jgi:hypothetical protein